MKKIFTLVCALMGFAGAANAATVDDIEPLKHSYVLVCDELGARPGAGVLFGANHFLDIKGGSTATNKGTVDLSVVDGNDGYVTQEIVDKYGEDYAGPHYNWLRLKNQQDMLALKLTAKSKIIIFEQGNNKSGTEARIPRISTDAAQANSLNPAPDADHPATVSGFRWEFTVDDDGLYYLGSYNGDMFVSFIIIEANEAPGTPTVKLGDQTFEGGLWFREVSAKANNMVEEGSTEQIPTVLTYTTDGTAPTAESPKYTGPIKCYQNMTVKFQAFMDFGDGTPADDLICDAADNEANVEFSFDAPSISADGATFTITTPYAEQNGENYYTLNGGDEVKGDGATLTESAAVVAYTKIVNGSYATFTSKPTSQEVYVLDPIKEKQTITITGTGVVDEENSTEEATAYKASDDATINYDKKQFFVRNTTLKALMGDDAQYRIGDQELYLMMNGDIITFQVADGDSVDVVVTCALNSCKNINADDAEDGSQVNDRKNYINVDGTNYFATDAEGNETSDMKIYAGIANIVKFGLGAGIHTFKKYSGTGNILVSSIEITPASNTGISTIAADASNKNAAIYNLAGQKVNDSYKGVVIQNGKKFVVK